MFSTQSDGIVLRNDEYPIGSRSSFKPKLLMPVVKIGEIATYSVLRQEPIPAIVIRLKDLVNSNGRKILPIVDDIEKRGGIHEYLQYPGDVVVSSIMTDRAIAGCSGERYYDVVNSVDADYYFTPDGETYLSEPELSSREISRLLAQTDFLLNSDLSALPIGLVNGCSNSQVHSHSSELSDRGVDTQVFHVGGYNFRSSKREKDAALTFVGIARDIAKTLYVYGGGCKNFFLKYLCADGYITQTHYINAFKGKMRVGDRYYPCKPGSPDTVASNFAALDLDMRYVSNYQTYLDGYAVIQTSCGCYAETTSPPCVSAIAPENKEVY